MKNLEFSFCPGLLASGFRHLVSLMVFLLLALSQVGISQGGNPLHCGAGHTGNIGHATAPKGWGAAISSRSVVEIPVVVHIVWNTAEEDISDEQVFSQIEVLNQDFRATNVEVPGIPSVFQALVADVEMEFCLAKTDPEGNATGGIVRTFTQNSVGIGGSSDIHYSDLGGSDAWDTERYLNIWVAKFAGGVGGIASFPGEGPAAEQGVEVDYRQFGTINVDPPYHLGRTCTHEIGHYFNLEHPWGPGFSDCCEDDFVDDTPEACDTYLGECPSFPISSCSGPDLFMDFMFYTNDECMGMFTLGQKERMLSTLNGVRSGLLSGGGCVEVPTFEKGGGSELILFGNPSGNTLRFEIRSGEAGMWDVELINTSGKVVLKKRAAPNTVQAFEKGRGGAGLYFLVGKKNGHRIVEPVLVY